MIALLADPSGTSARNWPTLIVSGTDTQSRRIIRPAVRFITQPMSRGLRMVDPRRCSRQVEKE